MPSVYQASRIIFSAREINVSDLVVKISSQFLFIKNLVVRYYCSRALMLMPKEAYGYNELINKQNIY